MFSFWQFYMRKKYSVDYNYDSYKLFTSTGYINKINDIKFHGKWDCLLDELCMREYNACSRIQYGWRESISNPSFKLCKKRLLVEFNQENIEMYKS
jgi:hypothetical protein